VAQDSRVDAKPRDLWWFRKNVPCLDACPVKTDAGRYVQLIAEGLANKEIANKLNLSIYTVDTHRSHILRKLNLHSVPEVILYAVRKNIIA